MTGAVLLGYGHGGAAGWAGTWATSWSAVCVALLSVLFVMALRAIDVDRLRAKRITRARQHVDDVVDRVILERISQHILKEACDEAGVEISWFGGDDGPRRAIAAKKSGRVHNINLRQLRRGGREAEWAQLLPPAIAVKLGDWVREDTGWLFAQPVLLRMRPSLGRALTVREGSGTDEELRETLDQLHEEALKAIAAPAPSTYREIVDAYTDIVLRLPEAWARYGQRLEDDIGVASDLFGWTFLDTLRSNAYEEALYALGTSDRDIPQEILNFPLEVARRAIPLRAFAIARTALEIFNSYHDALLRSDHPHREMLRSWFYSRLREFADFAIEPSLTRSGPAEARKDAARAMADVFNAFADVSKTALEHDPRRLDPIREVNTEWDQLLRHWEPESARPQGWLVDHLERERGANDPEVRQLRAAANENAALASMKTRLVNLRRLHRFGLCYWALRRVTGTQNAEWLEAFDLYSGYFSSPTDLTVALGDALRHEWEHHGPWSNWILRDLSSFEAHSVSPDFLPTYLVLMLRQPPGDVPELPVDITVVNQFRVEPPINAMERVMADPHLSELLPAGVEHRAEQVVEALERLLDAAKRAEEDEALTAPVDETLVREFQQRATERWSERRMLRAAFVDGGRLELVDGEPLDDSWHGVVAWQTKRLFLRQPRVYGHERAAEELAQSLLRNDTRDVLRVLGVENGLEPETTDSAADLRRVIAEMGAAGMDPRLVLIPTDWSLIETLELTKARGWGGDADAPSWLPTESRTSFKGVVDGVPAISLNAIPSDRLAVVDTSRVGPWREWSGQRELEVTIEEFDDVRAASRAAGDGTDGDVDQRARLIQLNVLVAARAAWQLVAEEPAAARWVRLISKPRE